MKFIVDEIPKGELKCPFSDWMFYPPVVEKTGDYKCSLDDKVCDLSEEECRWLKQQKTT